jgi:hypothetical protein
MGEWIDFDCSTHHECGAVVRRPLEKPPHIAGRDAFDEPLFDRLSGGFSVAPMGDGRGGNGYLWAHTRIVTLPSTVEYRQCRRGIQA